MSGSGAGGEDRHGALVDDVARRMTAAGLTLALAESCTGGLLGAWITARPGASAFLLGGVVAYADRAKVELLGVDPATLPVHGAVSEATARAMASGACLAFGADAAVAVTGIAGPAGGTPGKPVGTVWVATALHGEVRTRHERFAGDRAEVRVQAALVALSELVRRLDEAAPQLC